MTDAKLQHEGEVDYAKPLPRALLRDRRLSFGARGLFAMIWDLPKGWVVRLEHLVTMGTEGRDALRARLRELQDVGALRIEAIRHPDGKVAGSRWVIVSADRWAIEASLSQKALCQSKFTEKRVFRPSVKPSLGESQTKGLQNPEGSSNEAEENNNSAASSSNQKQIRNRRKSGIVTWWPSDVAAAIEIETQHSQEDIAAAVKAVRKNNQDPVPGLVQRALEEISDVRHAESQRQAAAEDLRKRFSGNLPPEDPNTVAAKKTQLAGVAAALRASAV